MKGAVYQYQLLWVWLGADLENGNAGGIISMLEVSGWYKMSFHYK